MLAVFLGVMGNMQGCASLEDDPHPDAPLVDVPPNMVGGPFILRLSGMQRRLLSQQELIDRLKKGERVGQDFGYEMPTFPGGLPSLESPWGAPYKPPVAPVAALEATSSDAIKADAATQESVLAALSSVPVDSTKGFRGAASTVGRKLVEAMNEGRGGHYIAPKGQPDPIITMAPMRDTTLAKTFEAFAKALRAQGFDAHIQLDGATRIISVTPAKPESGA